MELQSFLDSNRLDLNLWERSKIDWHMLQEIAEDHLSQIDHLRNSAEFFARVVQGFPSVHSVRWRVKDVNHLLVKIIRKRADEAEKYKNITPDNYFEIVTDLIGLRALHLFKDDCFSIDGHLKKIWVPVENPIAYVREGDPEGRLLSHGFNVKKHPAGYRSVHYVVATQPLQRRVTTEIQVRTIFEEGWSEIDHRVRYPNFSDDQHVSYFLTIFNRLAGSADEMGTFVQGLTEAISAFKGQLIEANKQKEEALSAMDSALRDLELMKRQDGQARGIIDSLQREVSKLRTLSVVEDRDKPFSVIEAKKFMEILSKNPHFSSVLEKSSDSFRNEMIRKLGGGKVVDIKENK